MLKKTVEYTDFNGNKRTEEHCFHLSKAEVVEWLTTSGDYTLDKVLEKLATERNGKEIMSTFKDLIYRSYGKISLDGKRFEKSEEVKKEFMESEAYSEIFMEIISNADAAVKFIAKVLPSDLSDEIEKIMRENPEGIPDVLKDYIPTNGGGTNFPVVN